MDEWRRRFREEGLEGSDRPRSGRPRVYGPEERLALVRSSRRGGPVGRCRLKARMSEAARLLRERHGIGISDSVADLPVDEPQVAGPVVETSMTRQGRHLRQRPEAHWAVFSIDEKTYSPTRAARAAGGRVARRASRPGVRVPPPRHQGTVRRVRVRHRQGHRDAHRLDALGEPSRSWPTWSPRCPRTSK